MKKSISRRSFLKAVGALSAAGALAACGGSSTSTAASTASSAAPAASAEASGSAAASIKLWTYPIGGCQRQKQGATFGAAVCRMQGPFKGRSRRRAPQEGAETVNQMRNV